MIISFYNMGGGGGSAKLEEKNFTITQNGDTPIVPSEGFDGIFQGTITTNVQPKLQEKTVEITGNGLTDITPDTGNYGLSKVRVNTNVQSTGSALDITGTGWETEPYFPIDLSRSASLNDDIEYTRQKYSEWDPSGTSLQNKYQNDKNLIYAPKIDTSQVIYVSNCFSNCTNLTSIPTLDTSKSLSMGYFLNGCSKLTSVPQFDTSKAASMSSTFFGCSSLTIIPQFNTSKVTTMNSMFKNCKSLTSVPQFDTSNVTDMQQMFSNCLSLTSVPQFDTSNVTNMDYIFDYCRNITTLGGFTGLRVSLDLNLLAKLTHQSLLNVINGLATVSNSPKLTLGPTNLAKLTAEEKAVATNKGWVLA